MAFTLSHSPAHNGYLYFKLQMVMMQFIIPARTASRAGVQCFKTNRTLYYRLYNYDQSCTRVIAFHNTSKTINSIIGNGKRFIAYDIVKRLEKQQENTLLSKMQSMVNTTQKADNKLHEVFEPSFDWKPAWRQTGNAEHQHSYNRN